MERESFESLEIAEILNKSFIPIKVDREERPDIDAIYMNYVQVGHPILYLPIPSCVSVFPRDTSCKLSTRTSRSPHSLALHYVNNPRV